MFSIHSQKIKAEASLFTLSRDQTACNTLLGPCLCACASDETKTDNGVALGINERDIFKRGTSIDSHVTSECSFPLLLRRAERNSHPLLYISTPDSPRRHGHLQQAGELRRPSDQPFLIGHQGGTWNDADGTGR